MMRINGIEYSTLSVELGNNSFTVETNDTVGETTGFVEIDDDGISYSFSTDDYSDITKTTLEGVTTIIWTHVDPIQKMEEQVVQLQQDVDISLNTFMLYDFAQEVSGTMYPCTSDSMPSSNSTGRIDITLPEEMQAEWAIKELSKWEVFNGTARVPAMPVFAFSMNGQIVLRTGFVTTGSEGKPYTRISGALLLKKREYENEGVK